MGDSASIPTVTPTKSALPASFHSSEVMQRPKAKPIGNLSFSRYKGRLYDSCITLDSDQPWCSTRTDVNHEHIPSNFATCPDSCHVNDCPLGYYRLYPDQTCVKVSGFSGQDVIQSYDAAKQKCSGEGGRLWQLRTLEGFEALLEVFRSYFIQNFEFGSATDTNKFAIGLEARIVDGEIEARYPDTTRVPKVLLKEIETYWKVDALSDSFQVVYLKDSKLEADVGKVTIDLAETSPIWVICFRLLLLLERFHL